MVLTNGLSQSCLLSSSPLPGPSSLSWTTATVAQPAPGPRSCPYPHQQRPRTPFTPLRWPPMVPTRPDQHLLLPLRSRVPASRSPSVLKYTRFFPIPGLWQLLSPCDTCLSWPFTRLPSSLLPISALGDWPPSEHSLPSQPLLSSPALLANDIIVLIYSPTAMG